MTLLSIFAAYYSHIQARTITRAFQAPRQQSDWLAMIPIYIGVYSDSCVLPACRRKRVPGAAVREIAYATSKKQPLAQDGAQNYFPPDEPPQRAMLGRH